jgi:hypothetical protein
MTCPTKFNLIGLWTVKYENFIIKDCISENNLERSFYISKMQLNNYIYIRKKKGKIWKDYVEKISIAC